MPRRSSKAKLPLGYTFQPVGPKQCVMVSIAAKARVDELVKDAQNRNPDNFDLYIYNGKEAFL